MMKQLLILMIMILSVHSLSGQTESTFNYFNKTYNTDTTNMVSVASEVVEGGYLLTGVVLAPNDYTAIYLRKIDSLGQTLWYKIVDDDQIYTMLTGRSMIKDGNNVYLIYTTNPDNDEINLDIVLLKCDLEGNVIWRKTYGEFSLREGSNQVIQTEDSGFFITGHQQVSGEAATYYCVKTDSLGNEEWSNTYQLDGHSIAFYGYQTEDGGYILSGGGYSDVSDYDLYVVKLDQNGEMEWEENYGSDESDTGAQIKIIEDQYLLMASRSDYSKHYFYYLDQEGNLIYEKEFEWSEIDSWSYGSVESLLLNNNILGITTYFNEYGQGNPLFVLFDENGDSLWTRSYTLDPTERLLIKDLDPTPDGGYLLTGFHDTPMPQYSWVAKVDSLFNGCIGISCDSSVTIIDTTTSMISFLPNTSFNIHPNPIKEQGAIQYRLPMEEPYAILRLFDLEGNECKKKYLHTYQQEAILEVTDLSAGLYTYVVELGRWRVAEGKLVVE